MLLPDSTDKYQWNFIVYIVLNIRVMDFIYGRFIRDQMISINLVILGVASGITTAVFGGFWSGV